VGFVCVQAQARELEAELRAFADPEGAGAAAPLPPRAGGPEPAHRGPLPALLPRPPGHLPLLGDSSVPEGTEAQRQLVQVRLKQCCTS